MNRGRLTATSCPKAVSFLYPIRSIIFLRRRSINGSLPSIAGRKRPRRIFQIRPFRFWKVCFSLNSV